jgi:Ca2+-binding EF-hand superfamily protein
MYDVDRSGYLTIEEITEMAHSLIQLQFDSNVPNQEVKTLDEEPVPKLRIENLVAKLRQMDANGDKKISFAEFFTAVQTEPAILKCFSLTNNVLDDKFNDAQLLMNIRSKGKFDKKANENRCIIT